MTSDRIEPPFNSDPNDPAALLHELWNGEYDEVTIRYEPTHYRNPHTWIVDLVARTEFGNDHQADWVERRWSFYDESLWSALTDAVTFASALRELAPDDE